MTSAENTTPGMTMPRAPGPEPAARPSVADPALLAEIAALRAEVATLNRHRYITLHNSPLRLIFFQFVRGLALGLGTVVGATILVSVLVYLLSSIDFIPIIGDWAADIAKRIAAELQPARD